MTDDTVTTLLRRLSAGDAGAADDLLPRVYRELRQVAHRQLRSERPAHTLNTTALVHEAWMRVGLDRIAWHDRAHFFAVAARAMRRVLIDYAAARRARKRGSGAVHVPLDDEVAAPQRSIDDLLALEQALERLEQLDPRQVRVVECRVFAGLSIDETARALETSPATVSRDWMLARAWLNRALRPT